MQVYALCGTYIALSVLALLVLSLLLDSLDETPELGTPRPSITDAEFIMDDTSFMKRSSRDDRDGIDNHGMDDSLRTFQLHELSYR